MTTIGSMKLVFALMSKMQKCSEIYGAKEVKDKCSELINAWTPQNHPTVPRLKKSISSWNSIPWLSAGSKRRSILRWESSARSQLVIRESRSVKLEISVSTNSRDLWWGTGLMRSRHTMDFSTSEFQPMRAFSMILAKCWYRILRKISTQVAYLLKYL